ncbi:MAG TPA: hypothetical protein VMX11_04500, partial [Actinomycetes bacterium]|nr:hypothetical protein [Actinomycetes bacterium]
LPHPSPAREKRDYVSFCDVAAGERAAPARQHRTPRSIRRLTRPELTGHGRAKRTDLARLRRYRSASPTYDV